MGRIYIKEAPFNGTSQTSGVKLPQTPPLAPLWWKRNNCLAKRFRLRASWTSIFRSIHPLTSMLRQYSAFMQGELRQHNQVLWQNCQTLWQNKNARLPYL